MKCGCKFSIVATISLLLLVVFGGKCVNGNSSDAYENFRILFGNATSLKLYDIDQISSKIISQLAVNCSQNSNLDCLNCLSSSKLQTNSIIGSVVTHKDLAKVSLLLFCYLMDFNQFCTVNSMPDYSKCFNFLTNYTGSLNVNSLNSYLNYRVAKVYKGSVNFYLNKAVKWNQNCIDGKFLIEQYSKNGTIRGSGQLDELFSDVIFMMYNNMKIGCDMPYSNWFIDQLFTLNGSLSDSMQLEDLKNIMLSMNLNSKEEPKSSKKATRNRLISTHFQEPISLIARFFNIRFNVDTQTNVRLIEQSEKENADFDYDQCYDIDRLSKIFSLSNSISQTDFMKLSPSLIYMSSKKLCTTRKETSVTTTPSITTAQKYGYGTIAIVIVSLLALLGIVLIPCFNKSVYEKILMVLTSLAVGTLLSDALLHLVPEILGIEEENESGVIKVPAFAVNMSVAIGSLWIFWLLETLLFHLTSSGDESEHGHGHAHGHGHSHAIYPRADDEDENDNRHNRDLTPRDKSRVDELTMPPTRSDVEFSNEIVVNAETSYRDKFKFQRIDFKKIKATGWILLLGDAIHNFADGIAIGASFSQSARLGISTSIAVVCHEIPHELGNYAVLVKSGFSSCQALIFNFFSALTCLIGFYVGASISVEGNVSVWIFTVTAGMFIYLSLVSLLPTVMSGVKWKWSLFLFCNLAMFFGFSIMFLLVIFEDHIQI